MAAISSPVGFVILNWGFIEQALAGIVEATSNAVGKAGLKVKRHRAYGPKLDHVRSLFAQLPEAKPFEQNWNQISAELDRLETFRHLVSHGTIGSYDPEKKILTFNRVNPDPTRSFHDIEEIPISVENIEKAADVSMDLATRLGKLATEIMDAFQTP